MYLLYKVVVRSPNGLPVKDIPVEISVSHASKGSTTATTNDEGVADSVFNLDQPPESISVQVGILQAFTRIVMSQIYSESVPSIIIGL